MDCDDLRPILDDVIELRALERPHSFVVGGSGASGGGGGCGGFLWY